MRKLLIAMLCCLPATLYSQWSVVPSGSVGMSDFKLEYKSISEFSPDVGFGGDVSLRYSIPYSYFYISAGVGFQRYKSTNDAEVPEDPGLVPGYVSHAYLDESLSTLYVPVMVGFYLPEKKISPLVEVGGMLNIILNTGDFTEASGYKEKSTMFSFMAGAGARYRIYKNNVLEVKLRYTQTTNMLELSDSSWSYFSLNVGYSIML